jgi:hypothetical protein
MLTFWCEVAGFDCERVRRLALETTKRKQFAGVTGWFFELKWDGFRAIAETKGGELRLSMYSNVEWDQLCLKTW